jgi:putative sugar O-methyltransferase
MKHFFRKLFPKKDILEPILLPASSDEQVLIDELRSFFKKQPINLTDGLSPAAMAWANNMNRLQELVLKDDPRRFLRWDVIAQTMFVRDSSFAKKEFNNLKQKKNYLQYWHNAIAESNIGCPICIPTYQHSSGNLIHHAYHIAQFEEKTNIAAKNIDFIFEFGGGYGSICRLFYKLDFNKKYVIFDLPHFSALQSYYLKSLGIPVYSLTEFKEAKSGVLCISDIEELKQVLIDSSQIENTKSLFIATWSISETPIDFIETILPLISKFNLFLIAYQNRFEEVDNTTYFKQYTENKSDTNWCHWEIPYLKGSNYLIGNKS